MHQFFIASNITFNQYGPHFIAYSYVGKLSFDARPNNFPTDTSILPFTFDAGTLKHRECLFDAIRVIINRNHAVI